MSNFIIDTNEKVKEKLDLIQNLIDIKIAHKIMNPKKPEGKKAAINPADENYTKLNCDIKTLGDKDKERVMIEEFLKNGQDGRKLKLMHAYKVKRHGEEKTFNPKKYGNKKLLWHGSRFSNYVGILS